MPKLTLTSDSITLVDRQTWRRPARKLPVKEGARAQFRFVEPASPDDPRLGIIIGRLPSYIGETLHFQMTACLNEPVGLHQLAAELNRHVQRIYSTERVLPSQYRDRLRTHLQQLEVGFRMAELHIDNDWLYQFWEIAPLS